MISYGLFCRLRQLHDQQHLNAAQIARELQLDERTVAHWIAQPTYRPRARIVRPSKLDPFKGTIVRLLAQHPFTAAQILQRLREEGYQGGHTILRQFVATVRPRPTEAYLTLQFAPGQAAQVDWASAGTIPVGSTRRRLSFFVMVLCFSRRMYVEFCLREAQEHFLQAHQNAFEFFGGAPHQLIVDNCKVAVTRHERGQAPVFNPRYLDFAHHHGCELRACNPFSPHEKGRVEKAVDYVKRNFLAGLELTSLDALNAAVKLWLCTVANVRQHGATGRTPDELFAEEKAQLRPLPAQRYDVATVHAVQANRSFRVAFEANHYSVPAPYAQAQLTLKAYPHCLVIFHGQSLIAEHPRSYERRRDFEHPEHPRPLLENRFRAHQQRNLLRFLQLGPAAEPYYHQLRERRANAHHHVARIVALSEIHGPDPTARALADALEWQAFSAEYVANLLDQRRRPSPEPAALHLTRASDLLQLELPTPDLSLYQEPS
jgi:transposase